ncbi:hypothetical protein FOTG_19264 [Fusarium oxysporum f. sp. vasinfectum 25433]|uniref:Uncharacterized protein n=1 Tax=Fusarium oxysporum f. sp. vasinfectum 25433 TaxID=1089449 RepID=X0LUN2_FUSOX|nr:hypothetical protein FOTG_19264 [Fusarium oxysporum f. sp. vasinfectum 25433]
MNIRDSSATGSRIYRPAVQLNYPVTIPDPLHCLETPAYEMSESTISYMQSCKHFAALAE